MPQSQRRDEFADIARENVASFLGYDPDNWSVTVGDLAEALPNIHPDHTVDRVILDMLAPWECIEATAAALKPMTGEINSESPISCAFAQLIPSPSATPRPTAAAPGHPTKATHFASPSTLSALPTVKKALTLHNALWAAAITVVLVLLVAFPTHLFNTATEHGAERARDWWSKHRPRRPARPAGSRSVEYRGWPLAAGGVLLASLISSFVDPTFGFNASSVRVQR